MRPWAKRAEQLIEKEGHCADYAAFVEWFDKQDRGSVSDGPIHDSLDFHQTATLYLICCSLADGTARELPLKTEEPTA